MDKIKLRSIKVYAYHGCLIEEGKIGSDYTVDISVKADLKKPSKTDQLSDTVDYVLLNNIVKQEMAIRANLLEEVCQRIVTRVMNESDMVQKVKVSVSKINPPIGGDVSRVSVIMSKKR